MPPMNLFVLSLLLLVLPADGAVEISLDDVKQWANLLGEDLYQTFREATKATEIQEMYSNYAQSEVFDPRLELKQNKKDIEEYLKKRSKMAWDAKISLQARPYLNISDDIDLNDPRKSTFVRFMSAKTGANHARLYFDDHYGRVLEANATEVFNYTANANFYGKKTSSAASAVHVPTPQYNRDADLLRKIEWSRIDELYRANRQATRDLSFQLFCSESSFMRYYPATPWVWDNPDPQNPLDLFDCRSTEWYINGATLSKNVMIMLDMSGSMLGQRFEIAKQTIESVLETLSDNDFFNIMPFSKKPYFLDECAEQAFLLQATMRNKKLMRSKLNNVTSEGKAEYEKALAKAFETLLNLRTPVNWTTPEQVATKVLQTGSSGFAQTLTTFGGHVMGLTDEYLAAIKNYTKGEKLGCNNVIMLITDGAPDYYKEVFQLYNADKKIRFFSFLIGDEATDFDQVKWMACTNKGFMVHVANLADVQEKVQHYIKVMSRPVAQQADAIGEADAVWSGIYRERLFYVSPLNAVRPKRVRVALKDPKSEKLVTTVSYPVVHNNTFMGVTGVTVPVIELKQLIPHYKLGGLSYSFMLDNNGYVMFHPQLRPIEPNTKQPKPNYNSMDILELEVPQNQKLLAGHRSVVLGLDYTSEMRSAMIKCDNTDPKELKILYAIDDVGRVYRQTNTYYAECIEGALFTIGMAIAKGDEHRIARRSPPAYGQVQMSWFEGKNWRIHPEWRYCLVNDSDANISPEEAFTIYAKQMREGGALPELCLPRKELVDRLLLDIEVTNSLTNYWDINWEIDIGKGIHLVFFATPTGLIRFADEKLPFVEYEDPNWAEPDNLTAPNDIVPKQMYQHFILDDNKRTSEDSYFQRAVRMRDRIVFDTNLKTKVWYTDETTSAFGHRENVSVLMTATQAIFMDKALVGVVGVEMLYDSLAQTLKKIGCGPGDDKTWCFLLDEHAYIVYSSLNTSRYSSPWATQLGDRKNSHLGKWFGHLNLVTEMTMGLLHERGFYVETTYVDYQALCQDQSYTVAGAMRLLNPFLSTFKSFHWIGRELWSLLTEYTILGVISAIIRPTEAYTASFHDLNEGLPCDKASHFYLANWKEENWESEGHAPVIAESLIPNDRYDKPCKQSAQGCAVKIYASWVPKTNLLLVAIAQKPSADTVSECYNPEKCPMSVPPKFLFGFTQVYNATDKHMDMLPTDPESDAEFENQCRHIRSKERKSPSKCFISNDDEAEYPCSNASLATSTWLLICIFALLSTIRSRT
uniref:VWFA domain-containing protein n=1 Tax=Plectus sambesii TaxID=2011161 RepID=A0A914XU51_9BILA